MSDCFPDPPHGASREASPIAPRDATPKPSAPQAAIPAEEVLPHIPALRIYARSLCRDAVLADDLVQDALLRAIASIGQFRPGTNLRGWLFTILRNSFYTQHARTRRETTGAQEDVATLSASSHGDEQLWVITHKEVERALARMPLHYSEALIMVAVLGSSYQETAEILACDIGTVKSRVNRARSRLKAELGELFRR